ncbi:hypothetical protein RBH20_20990 [Haloarcula sp. H-GB4]|uniref:hypothetical protein n=1 Tax=Haloarcula sp. H-GB4 TaxID=3069755 RepID=UPI0027AE012A|nr:hypothetical protein [Haloarcula sp. H-GB4]MDQ2074999.1 hypothetical protein [Haloarcula sp. H-GB4]
MVHLNVYECQLPGDDLRIWRYPSNNRDIPQIIDERYDSVTTDTEASPMIAVPTNDEGRQVLEDETEYEQNSVPWQDYLWIYSNLVQYSVIRHLIENHDFTPLQVDQTEAQTHRVNEVYLTDPVAEPVDGLEIRQGLKVRSRFWNFPDQGPFVGVNFAYTTTNIFTEPLEGVLDGVNNREFWLKMDCPADCTHGDCTFHGHDGLIGEFDGFTGSGEACQYAADGSGRYVSLSPAVDGIDANPPVQRVAMEASYANIRQWATDKYGSRHSGIIEDIGRGRLGIPDRLSEEKASEREAKYELGQLNDLMDQIDRDVELLTGQTLTIADQPMEVFT